MTSRKGPVIRKIFSDPPIFFARELPSTSDVLKTAVASGMLPPESTLLCAVQTRGRGRPGNRWLSSRGDLMMSRSILPDAKWSAALPFLSLAVADACLRTFDELGFHGILWKYPNDLCAQIACDGQEDRVGKIGGILVEPVRNEQGRAMGWIAGVGVNLRPRKDVPGEPFSGSDLLPMSLCDISRQSASPCGPILLGRILTKHIGGVLSETSPEGVRNDLERRLLWKGRWVVFRQDGLPGIGKIVGLSPKGELCLEDAEGVLRHVGPTARTIRPVTLERDPRE